MYPCYNTMQWRLHGIYIVANYSTNSDELKKKLGTKVATDIIGKYSYVLYTIKGDKTNRSIIVKNSQVYMLYKFWFKDTLVFKGHTYVLGDATDKEKISLIGNVDNWQIYSIKGIDSSREVIIRVHVNVPNVGSLCSDFIAYRVEK